LEEKDELIEAQNKAISELADKIDELTGGQFFNQKREDQIGSETKDHNKSKKIVNPFYRGKETSKIDEEEDLNDYSALSIGNDNYEELSTEQKKLIQELEAEGKGEEFEDE
tara:strand:+ start:413 stop:745 length:333 start_codon:yes stop_codon:yes gene_type:complete